MREKEKLILPCCILLVACCFSATAGQTLEQVCQSNNPIPVSAVCSTLGLTGSDPAVCPAIKLLEQVAQKFQPPRCNLGDEQCAGVELPPPVDPQGTVLPQDLPDVRSYHVGLPESLPYRDFMKHEGSTYFWYYRNLLTFFNWVPCTSANGTSGGYQYKAGDNFPAPKNWKTIEVFDLPPPADASQAGLSAEPLPFAALLKPDPSGSYKRRESCKKWYQHASKAALQSKAAGSSHTGAKEASSKSSVKTAAEGYVHHKYRPANEEPYRLVDNEPFRPVDGERYRPADGQHANPYYPSPNRPDDTPYRPAADVDTRMDTPYRPAADRQHYQPGYPTDDDTYRRYSEPDHPAADRRLAEPGYPRDAVDAEFDSPPRYMYEGPTDGEPYQRFAPYRVGAPRDYVERPNYPELLHRGSHGYRPYDDDDERRYQRGAHERPYGRERVYSPGDDNSFDYSDREGEPNNDSDVRDAPYDEPMDHGYQFEGDRYDHEFSYPCGEADEGGSKYNKHTSPHLILLVRSTITLQEWGLSLAYNQVEGATAGLAYGPGKFSAGYFYAAQAVWAGGLGETIEREIADGCRSITVAGYSLGAAVAQLLAVRIEALISGAEKSTYDARFEGAKPAPVTVVTFGSPNPGDATWANYFNKKVNARNIAFEGDLVAKIPCEPQMVGCPVGSVTVPTSPGPWMYKRTGANILFPASDMPFSSKYNAAQSWGALTKLTGQQLCNPDTFTGLVAATHICSYLCMTSPYVDGDLNMCWLDKNTPAPEGASLCAGCVG